MRRAALLLLLACSSDDPPKDSDDGGPVDSDTDADADSDADSDADADADTDADPVDGTLRAVDLFTNPISGLSITGPLDAATTGATGEAILMFPPDTPFRVETTRADYPTAWVEGSTAGTDFELAFILVSDAELTAILGSIGVTWTPGMAMVALNLHDGLNTASPVVGASASIDVPHDTAFIIEPAGPVASTTLTATALPAIVFPNVAPGTVTPTITTANGEVCTHGPGLVPPVDPTAVADAATLVWYVCE